MKIMLSVMVFAGAVAFAGDASAQDEEVQTRHIDFNDMLIDGELQRPTGDFATVRGQATFGSLVNIRREFIEEIETAANEDALE